MTENEHDATAAFLIEAGHLKRTKRAGWWIAGIRDPESVAEHSYRTGVIAYVLALMEGCNADRAAALALFHDVPEVRTGDVPSTGKRFMSSPADQNIIAVQTSGMPADVAGPIRDLISEFAVKETPEARCAKDADKIECLLQAREYIAQGHSLAQPWVDTMVTAVQTESGKRLVESALRVPVDAWWRDIVASYGTKPAAP